MPQPDFPEERILCGYMAAAEYHQVAVGYHAVSTVDRGSVQNLVAAEGHTCIGKGCGGNGRKLAGACVIFRI